VENVLAESHAIVQQRQQQQQQQQQIFHQHMIESQSSITSTSSIQTVLHQSVILNSQWKSASNNSLDCDKPQNGTIISQHQEQQQQQYQQQQQSTLSTNSNGSTISFATDVLSTVNLRHPLEPINSLLEHINATTSTSTATITTLGSSISGSGVGIVSGASAMSGEGVLNIGDVADLLHPQHAIITGGRSQEGCPLIIFPDNNNFNSLEEVDYQKLILYLTSVPS